MDKNIASNVDFGVVDVVVSQDFFPTIGGAHTWLYQVYRRWPERITLLTSVQGVSEEDRAKAVDFDSQLHGQLSIVRKGTNFEDISLGHWGCWKRHWGIFHQLDALKGDQATRVHCLRAIPDGLAGAIFKVLRGARVALVTYAHGEDILIAQTSRQYSMIARAVYSVSDVVICNSDNTQNLVKQICPKANTVKM